MATTEIPPASRSVSDPAVPEGRVETEAPALLIQLQDELSRSRKREAFWISLIFHLLLVIFLASTPKLFPVGQPVAIATAEQLLRDRELTFLELPPDAQKVTRRSNTDIVSDKDRIATSRTPTLDRKELRKILDSSRPGPPGPPAVAQQGAPPVPPQESSAAPQGQQNATEVAKNMGMPRPSGQSQNPQLESLPAGSTGRGNPFSRGELSPGSAIEQAARASAMTRGGGAGGDYGLGMGSPSSGIRSNLDILSDTQGVDFGPYLARVLHAVRNNWYNLIPEIARAPMMKRGKVSIEFAILKTGQIAGMRLVGSSTDVALDRAAWGGITASNPFPPLPPEFNGSYLALRFHFYYNPDKHDLD